MNGLQGYYWVKFYQVGPHPKLEKIIGTWEVAYWDGAFWNVIGTDEVFYTENVAEMGIMIDFPTDTDQNKNEPS